MSSLKLSWPRVRKGTVCQAVQVRIGVGKTHQLEEVLELQSVVLVARDMGLEGIKGILAYRSNWLKIISAPDFGEM